jgi:hypothetical protein
MILTNSLVVPKAPTMILTKPPLSLLIPLVIPKAPTIPGIWMKKFCPIPIPLLLCIVHSGHSHPSFRGWGRDRSDLGGNYGRHGGLLGPVGWKSASEQERDGVRRHTPLSGRCGERSGPTPHHHSGEPAGGCVGGSHPDPCASHSLPAFHMVDASGGPFQIHVHHMSCHLFTCRSVMREP